MLARVTNWRLGQLLGLVSVVALAQLPVASALAQDDESAGEEEESGDEAIEEEDVEGTLKVDKDQPAVTAGGLYTIETYPLSELERPLSLTKGVAEGRVGVGFDLSKGKTFETFTSDLLARYGIADTLEMRLGGQFMLASPEGDDRIHRGSIGAETAILYDMLDVRGSVEIIAGGEETLVDLVVGLPIKYRVNDKVAVFALERFFTIHTNSDKPDLEVGIGGVFQALENLALIARGTVILPQFETGDTRVPLQVDAQFTPANRIDIGVAAVLGNVRPKAEDTMDEATMDEEAPSPFDERAVQLFARFRL